MQCTNLPVEKYRFLNLFQGGAGRARKFPDFLSQWPNSQYYLNYLYSNIYQNIPLFKHKVHPGLITNLLWSPRLSYKYDTNILHEIRYSRQRWASLYRTRKNILLRSLQMCFSFSFVSIALDVKKTAVATVPRLREAVGYEEVDQSAARVRFEVYKPRPFLSSPPTRGWFLSLYLISQGLRSATFYKTH